MDAHLAAVARAEETARDRDEREEERRFASPADAYREIDDWLARQDRVINYLETVDPLEFWQDHTEQLTLPGDKTQQQVYANRLRGWLYTARKAQKSGSVHTFQRVSAEIVETMLANMDAYLEATE
jgi:hypothetical protein